ncbi:hypothetical protein [Devosia aurantiaca]|uniref:Uncharacterized protein n=1 Tax=Devosia aurantiaca TaxID=2714858 RepID=A0A6M1SU96_9HYPH|nr:hypothetical protein [Devosia aurantiaca]NGP18922.1 hypothetical protein [Devosia aurantiaca]
MSKNEKAVRDAAAALHDAIVVAQKTGLHVEWPATVQGLLSISISETAKSEQDAVVTVVAKGVEPGSPEHAKAEQAAQKAVNGSSATT